LGELSLEVGVGEDVGGLEAAQDVVGDAGQVAIRDGGFNGTLSGIGYRAMFAEENTEQVVEAVVGRDAVKVMNLVVERNRFTAPGAINGMRDEDMFTQTPCLFKLPITLHAICVR
jgi:hypothetical protein